jgi:hypothetical protein
MMRFMLSIFAGSGSQRTLRGSLAGLCLRGVSCICFAIGLFASGFLQAQEPPPLLVRPQDPLVQAEQLARNRCAACHPFPDPNLLDRKTWEEHTLPWMKIFMGLDPLRVELSKEAKYLKATGKFPEEPILPETEWETIMEYFDQAAPEDPLTLDSRPQIELGIPNFRTQPQRYRRQTPMTTMVHISRNDRRIYLGDAKAGVLDVMTPEGRGQGSLGVDNIPVSMTETEQGIYLTCIGKFFPSEKPVGSLLYLERSPQGLNPPRVVLDELPRPTHTEFADLNGDDRTDFVMCMFGNFAGRFSWFENLGAGEYREHVLIDEPGALRSVVRDFNGDGTLDIAVLVAQASEAFYFFYNDGQGNFEGELVFQKHPLFGHSYFEMVDFNRDGLPDILATNGDNGEYPSPLKKYHGVRIYLNQGGNRFEKAYFYPQHGAFKATAHDFDRDGDLDIASLSYFPDYKDGPRESFVYLENHGNFKFTSSTFRQCIAGRWLTMDVGDLDEDGDLDIVLGSATKGPSDVPGFLAKMWHQSALPFIILENTTR